DGRVGDRLRVELGGRDGARRAQRDPVPQPGVHRRRDVPRGHRGERRRRPDVRRRARDRRRRDEDPGRHRDGEGPRRGSSPEGGDVTQTQSEVELLPLDTSDVDRWVGKPVGGAELKEPIYENDIRRFVQAQHNPNLLHYDERFAAESEFGTLVAPQSFAVCTDISHGASAAIQGTIPGSHMLFGGDEWWFHGPRIYPGDYIRPQRL